MLAAVKAAKYLGAKVIVAAGADGRVKAALDLGGDAGVNIGAPISPPRRAASPAARE